jgi:hypothetical protein
VYVTPVELPRGEFVRELSTSGCAEKGTKKEKNNASKKPRRPTDMTARQASLYLASSAQQNGVERRCEFNDSELQLEVLEVRPTAANRCRRLNKRAQLSRRASSSIAALASSSSPPAATSSSN